MTTQQLLAQLGLGPGASNAEIEEAHDEVVAFLERAPGSLRQWAQHRISEVDEAYAILSGEGSIDEVPAVAPVAPLPAPVAPHPRRKPKPTSEAADQDWLDEMDNEPDPARHERRPVRDAVTVRPNRLANVSISGPSRGIRRTLLAGAAVVALVVGAVGVYQFGNPSVPPITGTPNPSTGGVDPAQVAADMQKLATNPQDITTLQDLADLYYGAGDYATAKTWLDKILVIDPKNVAALLGSGAVAYNTNDLTSAETDWRAVLAIDNTNVEAHYDLGFMYLSENDIDKVKVEWNQVIALAPDSDIAQTVATHLATLNGSPAPSGASTAAPSAAPSAGPSSAPASPAPSPAASPG